MAVIRRAGYILGCVAALSLMIACAPKTEAPPTPAYQPQCSNFRWLGNNKAGSGIWEPTHTVTIAGPHSPVTLGTNSAIWPGPSFIGQVGWWLDQHCARS